MLAVLQFATRDFWTFWAVFLLAAMILGILGSIAETFINGIVKLAVIMGSKK